MPGRDKRSEIGRLSGMQGRAFFLGWMAVAVLEFAEAPAQSDPLAAAELRLTERLTEARRPIVESHIRQLETIRRRLSPNRDAEKIKRVDAEIQRARKVLDDPAAILQELEAPEPEEPDSEEGETGSEKAPEGSVKAAAAAAEVAGAVNYNRGSRSLVFWYRKGDSASWTLPDVPEGGYRIFVVYSAVGNITGMELTVGEDAEELDLPNTGGVGSYESLNFMPYRSTGGDVQLEIAVSEDDARRRCRIRGVALIPEAIARDVEGVLDFDS